MEWTGAVLSGANNEGSVMKRFWHGLLLFCGVGAGLIGSGMAASGPIVVRIGHFPNITHAQAVVGRNNGWFDKALSPDARLDWKAFNAGPSAIEALFAGELDIVYVGPNPTISGYVRSHGAALRVIAGSVSGGAALVVRADSGIMKPEDFHGKRIASPQLGNTQDVALRNWLAGHNLKLREKGGDVSVIPVSNPDQLTLFLQKQLDASWAPEPWASRLIHDANCRLFLDERSLWPNGKFVITNVIVSTKFLGEHRDLVKRFVRAHVELTQWINQHPADARRILNAEIKQETHSALADEVLNDAYSRIDVTYDPVRSSLLSASQQAFDLGLLGHDRPDLSGLYDLSILNEVLKEKGLKLIP
jgi:NitT/TauT family transport system substrate-binding protein